MIQIVKPGFHSSVQDAGRFGHRSVGVGSSGAMELRALAIGNAALGNVPEAAAIEFTFGSFEVEALANIVFCLAGANVDAHIDKQQISRWWVHTMLKGQRLKAGQCRTGMRTYLCVLGGLDVPVVLGSKSTDLKGQFGGLEGRLLQAGDQLNIGSSDHAGGTVSLGISPRSFPILEQDLAAKTKVRFIPANEWNDLDANNQDKFQASDWRISPDSNRVGYRFSGPSLKATIAREMLSHGILPGTIQLPPSGQPVVQMKDANTAGGYPKLGKIIDADLPALAQSPPGLIVQFEACTTEEAAAARNLQELQIERIRRVMAVEGSLSFSALSAAAIGTSRTVSMLGLIIAAASFLSVAMGFLGMPQAIEQYINSLDLAPLTLILLLMVIYIILGSFLEGMSIIVITIPIALPLVLNAGYDQIWFGVFLLLMVELAQISPPVGMNLFVLQGLTRKPLGQIVRAALPFFFIMLGFVLLLALLPGIVTWLPNLLFS